MRNRVSSLGISLHTHNYGSLLPTHLSKHNVGQLCTIAVVFLNCVNSQEERRAQFSSLTLRYSLLQGGRRKSESYYVPHLLFCLIILDY